MLSYHHRCGLVGLIWGPYQESRIENCLVIDYRGGVSGEMVLERAQPEVWRTWQTKTI